MKEAGRRRRTLRIAAIQMIAAPGEPESRRARAETLVERAASEGAALVALREMFAPGYLASREVWDLAEPLDRGPTVAWLQRTARRFGIHVASGLVETNGRDFFDTFVVCMPRERFQSDTFDQSATKRKISSRTMRVLIGYASRFGSTRDIAMRIADTIRTHGNEVDVRSVEEISDCDPYDAVVFGSGVYDGSWTAEATAFMRRHAAALAQKPVWLFTVGSFGDRHPIVGGLIKKEPKEIGEFEQTLHPRDYRVFAGVIDLDHWPAWGRLLFKALGGHAGDNRQWSDIDSWAEEICREIRP